MAWVTTERVEAATVVVGDTRSAAAVDTLAAVDLVVAEDALLCEVRVVVVDDEAGVVETALLSLRVTVAGTTVVVVVKLVSTLVVQSTVTVV